MSGNTNKGTDNRVQSTEKIITLSSYPRAIVHIDGDAFFVSCEQAREPSLKGKPVVTGKERGIIACASYEAKALGIKRGISIKEAKRIYSNLIILPSDYETYSIYSERLFNIVRDFTPLVEEFSIDEAFCDLTGLRRIYRTSYPKIAYLIKKQIKNQLNITVSVGVSLTKTLAKICSRFKKPDGFTAIPGHELHKFLKDIPLDMVCGFGPNTVALLNKHHIKTPLDYVKRPIEFANSLLGKIGVELWRELRGEYVYEVCDEQKEKYLSISKTKTFTPASDDKDFVKSQLMRNLESAFIKLRRHKLSAKTLAVYLKTYDFKGIGLEAKLNRHSSSTLDFTETCARLFEMVFKKGLRYRATGVILSDIVQEGIDARDLFDDPVRIERLAEISKAIDKVNRMYGKHTIHLAASDMAGIRKKPHPINNLTWRKQDLLKGESFRKRLKIPLLKLDS